MTRAMKDSGIKWIGEIPANWKIEKIKHTLKYIVDNRGRTPDVEEIPSGIPLLELDAIGEKYPDVEKVSKFISQETYNKFIRDGLLAGDVLMGTVGSVGKCSIIPKHFNYCIAQNIVGFRFENNQESLFWYYYFQTNSFKHMFMQFNKGNIQDSIKISDMRRGLVCVPPKIVQQRVASFLDSKCQEIDNVLAKTRSSIEEYKKLKQAIITKAVTKGIRKNRKMKDSGIEWIGEMPKHWSIKRGKYILEYLQKPVKSDDGVITCFRDGEVTLRSNRREDGFTMSDKEIGYQGIDKGDLVVHGMDGFAGAIGISDSRGKASPVLNVLDSCCNKKYLMYYLRTMAYSNVFVALASGIRVRSCDLRWNKLASLPYPVTDIKEQSEIAQYIDIKCSEIDNLILKKEQLISELESYKKSLIYEYVTGKKEVPMA